MMTFVKQSKFPSFPYYQPQSNISQATEVKASVSHADNIPRDVDLWLSHPRPTLLTTHDHTELLSTPSKTPEPSPSHTSAFLSTSAYTGFRQYNNQPIIALISVWMALPREASSTSLTNLTP